MAFTKLMPEIVVVGPFERFLAETLGDRPFPTRPASLPPGPAVSSLTDEELRQFFDRLTQSKNRAAAFWARYAQVRMRWARRERKDAPETQAAFLAEIQKLRAELKQLENADDLVKPEATHGLHGPTFSQGYRDPPEKVSGHKFWYVDGRVVASGPLDAGEPACQVWYNDRKAPYLCMVRQPGGRSQNYHYASYDADGVLKRVIILGSEFTPHHTVLHKSDARYEHRETWDYNSKNEVTFGRTEDPDKQILYEVPRGTMRQIVGKLSRSPVLDPVQYGMKPYYPIPAEK